MTAAIETSREGDFGTSLFAGWLRRHQVLAFFMLTYAFSWSIYLLFGLLKLPMTHAWGRLLLIAAYAPSLAAMLISAVTDPARCEPNRGKRIIVFFIALAFAAAVIFVDSIYWGYKLVSYELLLNGILAILAAWTISSTLSRRQGIRQMTLPLTHWQINGLWYIVAIGLWPALVLLGNFISPLLGISVPANPWYPNRPFLALLLESFAWYALFGGPLNEEPGWRGFALPRLQRRFSPLTSGLIIGALVAFWHVPLHLIGAYPYGPAGAVMRIPDIATGIIFACLYNCTSSSLLPVLLLHASRNTTSLFLGRSHAVVFSLWLILAVVLVIAFGMWRRIPASTAPPD